MPTIWYQIINIEGPSNDKPNFKHQNKWVKKPVHSEIDLRKAWSLDWFCGTDACMQGTDLGLDKSGRYAEMENMIPLVITKCFH